MGLTREQAALRGDRAAWDELIRQHNPAVLRRLLRFGLPLPVAEELAGDTWSTLFVRAQEGRLRLLQLPGLALQQARFLCLEYARAAQRTRPEDAEFFQNIEAECRSQEDEVAVRERREAVAEALSTLSPGQQRILRLLYWAGLSAPEAARQLSITPQRVNEVACEARQRLRTLMKDRP